MIHFRPLPIMTAFAIIALAVLVAMGRWQYERYQEKLALSQEELAPMTIDDFAPIEEGLQLVYASRPEPGWRIFAPVRWGEMNLFVDAGFQPGPQPPDWRTLRFPASLRTNAPITGASITPKPPAPFTAAPSPVDRIWYAVDLTDMARAAGMDDVANYYIAIDYIGEDGRPIANPFAHGVDSDPLPPERHLGYAVTWWGIALVLIGIYFAYHIHSGRLRFGPPVEN